MELGNKRNVRGCSFSYKPCFSFRIARMLKRPVVMIMYGSTSLRYGESAQKNDKVP